ncbi:MAG TPA: ABC transporter ATP-binding protein, partial [Capsulimonadaceae bacterium]|nr:ABC transporter ATP-binding protein [Capsulimonadaceae bacterium]
GSVLAPSRRFVAVQDLSLSVPRGQIFGFLGPNGAGKTTTINMLLGNVYPTNGSGTLLGAPIGDRSMRRHLGFLPEKFQFHEFLTAEEFLDLHGHLYGMPAKKRKTRIAETLEIVGLTNRRKSKIREFSKGMQQRIGLAQAILNDPDLVILDEPTSALDPIGRRDVRDIVHQLKAQGKTVFLNSHLLSEIEMTCDEVAILKAGRVVRQGPIDALLAAPSLVQMRIENRSPALMTALESLARTTEVDEAAGTVTVGLEREDIIPELAEAVVKNGGKLMSLIPQRESLEDLFIRVVEGKDQPAS